MTDREYKLAVADILDVLLIIVQILCIIHFTENSVELHDPVSYSSMVDLNNPDPTAIYVVNIMTDRGFDKYDFFFLMMSLAGIIWLKAIL